MENVKKILVLGSGALQIGQAGEFDFSASQCLKALKEENISSVLVNPNIATYQTSKEMADSIYFLPVTPDVVERIIEKEKPDAAILSFGGQTALNCGVELEHKEVFKKHNVKILGTPIKTVEMTEDRDAFAQVLKEIDVPIPPSIAATTLQEAKQAAKSIGYPVILRAAYALGGLGSGFAENEEELVEIATRSLALSPQVLVEKSLRGWKEIEYEMVRDSHDNCISVCNMENVDPLGVHTGDSIVVAPSQTLTNDEYHLLRRVAIKVIRKLGVVGECNIQFALDPKSENFYVIEVNARLSRSSALASKATGYPLAYIAAKLALGKSLVEIKNPVTKTTTACFEPALDYIVIKMPRWDLKKFSRVSTVLGSSMKSVGEVMAIGRSFEEALQKALRMTETGLNGIVGNDFFSEELLACLKQPNERRILALAHAIEEGISLEEIYKQTRIDIWFLKKIKNIVEAVGALKGKSLDNVEKDEMLSLKRLGFSDYQVAKITNVKGENRLSKERVVREKRKKLGVFPVVKQIDTLAAEWPAQTNYLYLTYNGIENDIEFDAKKNIIVLGGGAYRIGSSVEFDWCCVSCVNTLKKRGYGTTVINCNPETVSTDYDICDSLYFEELSFERVMDIVELENPEGLVVSMGGQTPNNLVTSLEKVKILGTSPGMIDKAEDRDKFSSLLDELDVDQPEWAAVSTLPEAKEFAKNVGYPVIIRPSYVLSGAAMRIVEKEAELERCMNEAAQVSVEHPVVISKFISGAKEIEMDAVAKNGELLAYAISEHIEHAGVHSGDATLVLPAQKLWLETVRKIKKATKKIAKALNINGPFNIQYLAKDNRIKVIECNLRCSRTFPFVSKVLNVDFVELATKVLIGDDPAPVKKSVFDLDYVGVKAPQFSYTRLTDADPISGVEMASTGEVACLGENTHDAFLNALLSTGVKFPEKTVLLSTGPIKQKALFLTSAQILEKLGLTLYGSQGTAAFLNRNGVRCTPLHWPLDKQQPNIIDYLKEKRIDLVINIPKNMEKEELENDYTIRRLAVDLGIPLITNLNCATLFVEALQEFKGKELPIHSWQEYMKA